MPKISALPAAASVALTDILPEVSPAVGGVTYKATFQQVYNAFALGGAALTRVSDTNVTLTLGGSPTTALLNAASITAGWSGVLSVARGGTNASSASITSFNNITGYTAAGATGTTSTNLVFSTSPSITSATLVTPATLGVQQAALNMNSHLINNVTDPASAQDAATKAYVDAVATGLNIQASCVCASTTALTVTYDNGASGVGATLTNAGALAAFSTDGISPTVGQRVLIKNQASTLQNGIYTVTTVGSGAVAWVLTRATDFDTPTEIQPGDLVPVISGTLQAGSSWMQTATVAAVGVDAVTFIQFSASIPVTVPNGGTGITTTTAYGLIAGGTTATGAFQNIGAGTTGQLVRSNGASALPGYTTATFPATATGAGTILRADGTNWVATTLTVPNTVTSGSILYGSSANVVGEQTYAQLAVNASLVKTVKSQVFAATGTYTPSAGMLYCIVELWGAGGGGGGSAGAGGGLAAGGGGAGGGFSSSVFTAANIGATAAIVIGAGGAGGSAGANNGATGGNSTFTCSGTGATLTSNGGAPGAGAPSSVAGQTAPGAGGTATGGTLSNLTGMSPASAAWQFTVFLCEPNGGNGGGAGGVGGVGGQIAAGNAGKVPGGGGGGGSSNVTSFAGAAGGDGYCTVIEYCNQ